MFKILALAGGVAGAAGLSQYPEFSQQYLQRLAGQVDALGVVVADFEASALRAGLTRTKAFAQMTGTPFLEDRQADMRRTFLRYEVMSDNLLALRAASPVARMMMPQRMADSDTLARTWDDFVPAVPLSVAGAASAGVGFAGGWALIAALLALAARPFRRQAQTARPAAQSRKEPVVARREAAKPAGPVLMGERR